MEHSESNAIQDSISILSTLDPTRSSSLGKITLEVRYVGRWFDKRGPVDDEEDSGEDLEEDSEELGEDDQADHKERGWEGLDTILSRLADASIRTRERRLTFTLVVMEWSGNKKLMPTVRKWLPKLLPRFNESGLLHVHYMRDGQCRAIDDGCLHNEKPGCLAENFKDYC